MVLESERTILATAFSPTEKSGYQTQIYFNKRKLNKIQAED
jgi:hypothetical protein